MNELMEQETLLAKVDLYEERFEMLETLEKQIKDLKAKLKETMLEIGKETGASQVKWTTPKGIQITCSIGKKATYEEREYKEFNIARFQNEQPEMYEQYMDTKTKQIAVTPASNDTLRITMPKKKEEQNA